MPHRPVQRTFVAGVRPVAARKAAAAEALARQQAQEPLAAAAEPAEPESVQAHQPVPEVAPEELLERRRFPRPIPTPQVTECDEAQAWEIWSQWSNL